VTWYKHPHLRIIAGLILGALYGLVATFNGWIDFTHDWVSPFGEIFLSALKFIGVPLILGALITGIASLSNMSKLSRIGGRTIAIYLITTAIAVSIGLSAVNLIRPGDQIPESLRSELQITYYGSDTNRDEILQKARDRGPLQMIVDIFPENAFMSASDNRKMLQVVMIAVFVGIGLIQIPNSQSKPLVDLFSSLSLLTIRLVNIIMLIAPIGVFALIASTIINFAGDDPSRISDLMGALGLYMMTVVIGLSIHLAVTYGTMLKLWTPLSIKTFLRGIGPAQLVAFSTSSSGATLPVSMECAESKLGVSEEISSFVLPLGATINMDGAACYQAVSAVFIAQSLGVELSVMTQITIALTTILASIGSPSVPGAGPIMLILILESAGLPGAGIGLVLGVDRILDMIRTTTNVTGDAVVAVVIANTEKQLSPINLSENQPQHL
jgi:Na+/H+-dicarboxylate symporter